MQENETSFVALQELKKVGTINEIVEENHKAPLVANEQMQKRHYDIPTITLKPMNLSERSLLEFNVLEDMIRHTPLIGRRRIVIPYMQMENTPVLPQDEVPLSAICGVLSIVWGCA